MSISLDSPLPSHYRSKQAFLASLPPWRRLLARLNWHPTIEKKVASYASEQRTKQLKLENAKIRSERALQKKEDEQLKRENERLAAIDAKIAALWPSSNTSSTPAQATGSKSMH